MLTPGRRLSTAATLAGDVSAHVYVPNGSLWVGTTGATATGQFLAKRIRAVAGTYNLAVDAGGPADTEAPTVELTSPTQDEGVIGTKTLSATASDNVGVDRVEWEPNGVVVASSTQPEPVSGEYQAEWDTQATPNGLMMVQAVAYDSSDNSASSDVVAVNVFNGETTAPVTTFTLSQAQPLATIEAAVLAEGLTPIEMIHSGVAVGGFTAWNQPPAAFFALYRGHYAELHGGGEPAVSEVAFKGVLTAEDLGDLETIVEGSYTPPPEHPAGAMDARTRTQSLEGDEVASLNTVAEDPWYPMSGTIVTDEISVPITVYGFTSSVTARVVNSFVSWSDFDPATENSDPSVIDFEFAYEHELTQRNADDHGLSAALLPTVGVGQLLARHQHAVGVLGH